MKTISSLLLIFIFVNSCSILKYDESTIKIIGSDTMLELTKKLVDEFNVFYPEVKIIVEGGGSKLGLEKFIEGKADICMSSRKLYPEEAKRLVDKYNSLGVAHIIAIDALSIYVNQKNPIFNITKQELKNIFLSKLNNWNQLNSFDMKINPIIRTKNSGTYLFFKEYILEGEEYGENLLAFTTTKEIVDYIKLNVNAIGYGGIGYAENIKVLSIDNISPTKENIFNNKYPLHRYLYLFTLKDPDGNIKLFIDWVTSEKGQRIVSKVGFYPLIEINE